MSTNDGKGEFRMPEVLVQGKSDNGSALSAEKISATWLQNFGPVLRFLDAVEICFLKKFRDAGCGMIRRRASINKF